MDSKFVEIVERLVKEQGNDRPIDAKRCKAYLANYAQNKFKTEQRLLLIAIEAGAAQAIANANDLAACKKQQIRFLKDDRLIDENAAAEVIDLLAYALRGDRSKSITAAQNPQSQYNFPPQNSAQNAYNPPPRASSAYPPNAPYPSQPQNSYVEYIGFWARVAATIIDNFAQFAILFALFFALAAMGFFNSTGKKELQAIGYIAEIIFGFIYTIAFWISKQATPGKMAFGATIVDAATLGKPTTGQLIGRYFAYIISAFPLFLGFIWVAFDDRKRGWHDMLAGTLVIMRPKTKAGLFVAAAARVLALIFVLVIIAAIALPRLGYTLR
ncbi:MAG: RDD family protein [Helicobacteraceae bacterium]|jgi:uncharacterized RDD family membrane protein YckC|nr:RDD family protein [Helicobacteraceae bacterium]